MEDTILDQVENFESIEKLENFENMQEEPFVEVPEIDKSQTFLARQDEDDIAVHQNYTYLKNEKVHKYTFET